MRPRWGPARGTVSSRPTYIVKLRRGETRREIRRRRWWRFSARDRSGANWAIPLAEVPVDVSQLLRIGRRKRTRSKRGREREREWDREDGKDRRIKDVQLINCLPIGGRDCDAVRSSYFCQEWRTRSSWVIVGRPVQMEREKSVDADDAGTDTRRIALWNTSFAVGGWILASQRPHCRLVDSPFWNVASSFRNISESGVDGGEREGGEGGILIEFYSHTRDCSIFDVVVDWRIDHGERARVINPMHRNY